ncbi:MAG TPA: DUF4127 family protein, partial [bacterium]|nr:DUF4127 family protein [bacterium]
MPFYLPLDDRPPNLLWVVLLATIAGSPLCVWDRYNGVEAKWGLVPYRQERLSTVRIPAQGNIPLISLNTLAAGSLVGSRIIDPRTLEVPKLPPEGLYLFVVPRIEPTSTDAEAIRAYEEIRNFLHSDVTQFAVVDVLSGKSPVERLPVRMRSWVNRTQGWHDWLEACQIPPDRLLVLFDDNRHGAVSRHLRELYGYLTPHVIDGADEGGMLLLARYLRERAGGKAPSVGVFYTSPGKARALGRYEGLPLDEVLARQAAWIGLELVEDREAKARTPALLVHNWSAERQGDRHDPDRWNPNPIPPDLQDLISRLTGRPTVVADIAYANGADPDFAQSLNAEWQDGTIDLRGYAGWNTAANSLGTALAAITIDLLGPPDPSLDRLRDQF